MPRSEADTFKLLRELLELKEVTLHGEPNLTFEKFVATGDFPMHDYGEGFLCIRVRAWGTENQQSVQFSIGTSDDGGWAAYLPPMATKKAHKLVRRLAEGIKDWKSLPTEQGLNQWLLKFGLYGVETG